MLRLATLFSPFCSFHKDAADEPSSCFHGEKGIMGRLGGAPPDGESKVEPNFGRQHELRILSIDITQAINKGKPQEGKGGGWAVNQRGTGASGERWEVHPPNSWSVCVGPAPAVSSLFLFAPFHIQCI